MENSTLKAIINSIVSFPIVAYIVGFIKDFVISVLKTGPIPKHIALIMDGNRRYAKAKNLPLNAGHDAGASTLFDVMDTSFRIGINNVTIYAFSIENFNRSKEEVDTLFGMLRDKLKLLVEHEFAYEKFNKLKVRIIGNKDLIPPDILADLEQIEEKTKLVSSRVLNVCFPYTSRDDIAHSMRSISQKLHSKEIESKKDITLKLLTDNMYMGPESPPLDILIRTSGHSRLSDFMLWQCNYNCTIEFTDTLWPDFRFVAIVTILLKWSYFKTIQLEEESISVTNEELVHLLQSLPPPPPLASVSDRG